MKKIIPAIISLLILNSNLTAQESSVELDPVTVTAALHPAKISETGRNIISFKGSYFSTLPIHSLDELLRYVPGMEVQMRGPLGSQSDIVLRGGTFQQVLVLLDGIRVNDPNTGHFSSYIPISPSEIDHIEILKGASSAVYGSDAVGGVIQVFTKTFTARRQQNSTNIQGGIHVGEYNLISANAGLNYQKGNTLISAGLLSNNTKGRLQRGMRGYAHNNTASVSLTQFLSSKWQLSLRSAYDNRDFGAQNFYTTFLSDSATEEVGIFWNQARLSYTGTRHKLSFDIGHKKTRDEYLFNKSSIPNLNKSQLLQATITDEWKLLQHTSLVSGVQYIQKSIRSNDRGDHQLDHIAAFAVFHQSIGERLQIDPALRLDHNKRSGAELSPQLNVSFRGKNYQLRGNIGKTIRDADFTERFNNYNKPVVASGRIGDPSLEAERSLSYEIGADYFGIKSIRVSASAFKRNHKRLIDYTPTPYADMPRKDNLVPGGTYALAKNIARVNTEGVELDITWFKDISSNNRISGGAGLVWLHSTSSDTIPSFYASSHARFLTNFFINYTIGKAAISVTGIYKNRASQKAAGINASLTKDYLVLNAKIDYSIHHDRVHLFFQADNFTDKQYSDLLGAIMPGRWLSAGFNVTLNKISKN